MFCRGVPGFGQQGGVQCYHLETHRGGLHILVDKEDAHARKGIFMIDASAGFLKDGNKNRLRELDIHKIVDAFARQADIAKYARIVEHDEIEKNDFNLNIPRYIDAQTPEDIQDIGGHLRGGIPVSDIVALQQYWDVCPKLRKALFKPNRKGYVDLAVAKDAIKTTIYGHAEFAGFIDRMNAHFAQWQTKAAKTLKALKPLQLFVPPFELLIGLPVHALGLWRKRVIKRANLAKTLAKIVRLAASPSVGGLILRFIFQFVTAPATETGAAVQDGQRQPHDKHRNHCRWPPNGVSVTTNGTNSFTSCQLSVSLRWR